jgi:hypothetical protein
MTGFGDGAFPSYGSVLDEIAETGYEGTELGDWGFMPADVRVQQPELDRRRLDIVGALVPQPLADSSAHRDAVATADTVSSPGTAVTVLALENGVIVTIDNSWLSSYGYDQRLEAFASDGMVAVENELPHRSSLSASVGVSAAPPLRFFTRYAESYLAEVTAFVDCVERNTQPPVSGEDGRAAVLLRWRRGIRGAKDGR